MSETALPSATALGSATAPRVTVVTSGHLATCPRMLKVADALQAAGYRVRVVSTQATPWATAADAALMATRRWAWEVVRYGREAAPLVWLRSGTRQHLAVRTATRGGVSRATLEVAARAYGRVHDELVGAIATVPTDLIYAGTAGALAAAAIAARRLGVPYALDLEDYHAAEQDDSPTARVAHALIARIEHLILPDAAFLTAGSDPIGAAYTAREKVATVTINNVPERPTSAALPSRAPGPMRLVWLSQTVGPGRGLEAAVHALSALSVPTELVLRGAVSEAYRATLSAAARGRLSLVWHAPDPSRDPVELCAGADVGLALEQAHVLNRDLCLCNKPFTYMAAGAAVLCTDTKGQRPLAESLGAAATIVPIGDVEALGAAVERWAASPELLAEARDAAFRAARERWYWEHAEERGRILSLVSSVVGPAPR
jgi:glycosyltransferase involved in cell wall biosynthesis